MNIAEITVSGNLGQAPEIKSHNGIKVANFSVAVNEKYMAKGEKVTKTHWYNVEAWDGKPKDGKPSGVVTNIIEPLLDVGSTVFVRGFPQIDSWEDKDSGAKRTGFKIKIAGMSSMIRLAGSKSDGNGADSPKAKDGVSNDLGEDEIPF
jgi:single stranded DNA-binding protein|tara:strand:+ start:1360 stop:1806 length:447 start_codon:yes stop_codon:yes gene_type:complete